MVVKFIVDSQADEKMVEAWEEGFIKFMKGYKGKYINFVYSAEVQPVIRLAVSIRYIALSSYHICPLTPQRSISDETNRANDISVITISISWCFMLFYVTVFLGYTWSASSKLVCLIVTPHCS